MLLRTDSPRRRLLAMLACMCLLNLALPTTAGQEQGKCALGRDYWVYSPDTIDPDKTYNLVLGVHGYRGNGKGAGGLAGWAKSKDCIVLGPSYPDFYQYLDKDTDKQTLDLIKQLRKQYKLSDKIFVYGFSGGSQFAHRFAMKYPELVAGCAAHSGGTWATGDYHDNTKPNPKAKAVLFAISCGENDTGKSFGDAPMGRLEWAKKYAAMLEGGGYFYDAQWWPGVGHQRSHGEREMTEDCYHAAFELLPAMGDERDTLKTLIRKGEVEQAWAKIQHRTSQAKAHQDKGLVGKVYGIYFDSLEDELAKIDRWGVQQVRLATRDHRDDSDALRAALKPVQALFADQPLTPKTAEALADALANLP